MKTQIKIPGLIYERMLADLDRPHPIASERVGFAYARPARIGQDTHLMLVDYDPVDDADYIDDPSVGARINSAAIRRAMQGILDRSASCLHVHKHPWRGQPFPSGVDLEGNVPIAQSFVRLNPTLIHGMMILSQDGANASAWTGDPYEVVEVGRIRVIGFPCRDLGRGDGRKV